MIWNFLFYLPIQLWWNESRDVFKKGASVDTILSHSDWPWQCDQTTWISQILPQRYVCVGCQLNSDQAFRLLCLKGHVRALDSTLWRYRWQEASDFLCTKIPLLEGVEQRKNRGKIKKCSLQRAPDWCCCYSSWFHLGWHFWMLFRSSKFQALTSHWPRFSEQRRLSFELWALKELSRMSPQVGLAVLC